MRFLFACGGTGGHINPALAVARLVKEKRPDSEILFIGAEGGMETRLVPSAGFEIKTIKVSSISRKLTLSALLGNIDAIKKLMISKRAVSKIIKEFNPDVVLGTGGYVCYPTLRTAAKLKIPTVIHEANAFPGLATRALATSVDRVLLNFESGRNLLPEGVSCEVCGNPIREDILMYNREDARRELGIDKPLLVSFWGSLGAREMNVHTAELMHLEMQDNCEFSHIHASGKFGYEWMPKLLAEKGVSANGECGIWLREYIDDMPRVLAAADVVMCRGGAGTLSEICARGVPAIIIPSPNVTDNHQFKNAMELSNIGGARVIAEEDVTPERLLKEVRELLSDKDLRESMSKKLISSAVLDASERIYSEMIKIAKSR
ncbi:MAG: UDP-N-acetylglucosamine--N-acetylmuramyl-(pentapeptide) pyrophosphoryl-undecaprenol N-acetylglucosamine transferase [Oscillospiraceae bacterium]|nr:UDP-N-acetylglucosamine--N-acetylmuramyl-(pentapeptide) pyrophosphoryl-undecaprenol N-acetylglucosamine transferase [Oscillospiraceae bacterium]